MVWKMTTYGENLMPSLIPFKKIVPQERILRMVTRLTVITISMMMQLTRAVLRSGMNAIVMASMTLKALNEGFIRLVLNVDVSWI